jgi:NAD(P)-dependent dehydrogenase (short-subunit alcohol dehydrogenase family)
VLNDDASVILNGSANAHVGFAGASVYSASKAALHSLARTLSAELAGRGIRVNTLNIGPIDTPLYGKLGLPQEALEGFANSVVNKLPVKRFGHPEEVAKAAAFLASEDSSFILGSEISTDGGMMINAL